MKPTMCIVCFESPVGNGREDRMCHRCGDEIERTLRQEEIEVAAIEREIAQMREMIS